MKLLDALHKYFGDQNVIPIEKHQGVFCCEKKAFNEKTYQVVFIDTTNKWCEAGYSQYLESVVIDKYYQTEGFLQWNFYYYFIASKELLRINNSRKKEIENDETYTRKTVLTEEDFLEWLNSIDSISEIPKDAISNDLYTNWVNCLREKKLYFVYNSSKYPNYKQPVEDYINGIPSDDIDEVEPNESDNNTEPILRKIIKLELLEFREYPLKRNFDLGYVNLIHGANAVGKTSLFDAIELIFTGELNYKSISDSCNLKITDESNNILKYPTRPSPYKKRDIECYNSGANRGNNLNRNFNKFNYFSSDAAFQLKQDDETKKNKLETIIADIALGREVNKLEERIFSFNERFAVSADYYLKEFTRLNDNLMEKNSTIKELNKLQKDPQNYLDALLKSLKKNKWKTSINNDSDDFIAKLDNEIQTVNKSLQYIQSKNISIEKLSKENIENQLKDLKLRQKTITDLKNIILDIQRQRQVYQKKIDENKNILPIIQELSLYFKHEQFNFLIGIDKKIKDKTIELNNAKEIKELADSILSNEYFLKESEKVETVKQIEDDIRAREVNWNKKHNEVEIQIRQIEEGIEELSIIISNIKSEGKSYLKLNPKAKDCPLCNTRFPNKGLAEAIQRIQNSFTNSIALVSLKEELATISNKLDEIDKHLELINKLKQLTFLIFSFDGIDKTTIEIQAANEENSKKLSNLTASLIQLNIIQSQFNNSGITEDKFIILLNRFNELFTANIKTNAELDLKWQELINEQSEFSIKNNQLEKELNKKELLLEKNFTAETKNEEQLLKKLNDLQEIENNLKRIEIYLDFSSNTYLTTILEKTNAVATVFETYKNAYHDAKQHNQAIKLTENEIKKILSEIDKIKPKQKRAQFANTELAKLLKEQSKSEYLSGYIKKNKYEIVSIFKLIHIPREFDDISFENDKITLLTNEGSERTLSEISSGQRSALALSIFLSLNKKLTKGPNIIIFDEPVTNVDDMNILSFFDYLRELVNKTKRQVFFATANEDLAFLFKKKFEFLGSELTTHKLERSNEDQSNLQV